MCASMIVSSFNVDKDKLTCSFLSGDGDAKVMKEVGVSYGDPSHDMQESLRPAYDKGCDVAARRSIGGLKGKQVVLKTKPHPKYDGHILVELASLVSEPSLAEIAVNLDDGPAPPTKVKATLWSVEGKPTPSSSG